MLRLDGRFQGKFNTHDGDLIVGPSGVLISDIDTIHRLFIDGGHVHGKIQVSDLVISGKVNIKGDIICRNMEILELDPEAVISGNIKVNPTALDEAIASNDDPNHPHNSPVSISHLVSLILFATEVTIDFSLALSIIGEGYPVNQNKEFSVN